MSTISPAAQVGSIRLAADVFLLSAPDGSARLLNMNGDFHALSPVAASMLKTMLELGNGAAVTAVASEYDADPEEVRADLEVFLADLRKQRLIETAAGGKEPGPRGRWLGLALAPLLACIQRGPWTLKFKARALLVLARLSFAMTGWGATVTAWRRHPVPAAVVPGDAVQTIDDAVRDAASRQWLRVECKERALACWALLRAGGHPASLVVGVNFFPLAGHCWCESGSSVLSDDPERCAGFQPVVRYQ